MGSSAFRFRLTAVVPVLAALALAGCGGGGGGGGGGHACDTVCTALISCAGTIGSDVATLTGDEAMTDANCTSECKNNLTCTDKAAFLSCLETLTCTASTTVSEVQDAMDACEVDGGCE